MRNLLAILASLAIATPALSQSQSEPISPVAAGLAAYAAEGAEAGIKKWIEGGPLDGSKEILAQANMMKTIETYYGSYKSYDLVSDVAITEKVHFLYLVMNFEGGPVFAQFTVFDGGKGWKVTNFRSHTEPWLAWPDGLLTTRQ